MTELPLRTKDWPANVVQTVCRRVGEPGTERPDPQPCSCADCGAALVIHAESLRYANLKYPGMPVRTICVDCLLHYRHPDVLHDHRFNPKDRKPCTCQGVCRGHQGLAQGKDHYCVLQAGQQISLPALQ